MLDAILESSVFRFRRLIQTLPVYVVEPAMITTADASVLDSAKLQGSSAVRTVETQDA
jgi:hypothetical protein